MGKKKYQYKHSTHLRKAETLVQNTRPETTKESNGKGRPGRTAASALPIAFFGTNEDVITPEVSRVGRSSSPKPDARKNDGDGVIDVLKERVVSGRCVISSCVHLATTDASDEMTRCVVEGMRLPAPDRLRWQRRGGDH